jgi:hypothetical protein
MRAFDVTIRFQNLDLSLHVLEKGSGDIKFLLLGNLFFDTLHCFLEHREDMFTNVTCHRHQHDVITNLTRALKEVSRHLHDARAGSHVLQDLFELPPVDFYMEAADLVTISRGAANDPIVACDHSDPLVIGSGLYLRHQFLQIHGSPRHQVSSLTVIL